MIFRAAFRVRVARAVLPLVLAVSIWLPYREAKAILPLLVGAGVAAVDAVGTTVIADMLTMAVGSAVGTYVGALAFKAADGSKVRVPAYYGAPAAAIPAPSAPATAAFVRQFKPCGAGGMCGMEGISTIVGSYSLYDVTLMECQSVTTNCSVPTGTTAYNYGSPSCPAGTNPPQGTYSCYEKYGSTTTYIDWQVLNACPNGYTLSGGTCNLTDARQATNDAAQDFTRAVQSFGTYVNDLSGSLKALQQTISVSNDALKVAWQDAAGNMQKAIVQALASGGTTVIIDGSAVDASGASYTKRRTITVSPTGVLTGDQVTNVPTTQTYDPTQGTVVDGAAPTSTYSPAVSGGGSITFPSDYARQGEAAAAGTSVVNAVNTGTATLGTKLDTIHKDLTDPATGVTDPTIPDASQFDNAFFKDTFSGLLSWSLPSHSSQCPTADLSFTAFGHFTSLTMDAHCTIAEKIRPVLSVAAVVMWTLAALFVILGA